MLLNSFNSQVQIWQGFILKNGKWNVTFLFCCLQMYRKKKTENKEWKPTQTQKQKQTSTKMVLLSLIKAKPCKRCIASISISVLDECKTLSSLEGDAWKWGKAMRDGLHVLSLVESKYLATKSVSASDSLALNTGVWLASSTFPFFPRGMNCSIDSSIDTTSGLKICGIYE